METLPLEYRDNTTFRYFSKKHHKKNFTLSDFHEKEIETQPKYYVENFHFNLPEVLTNNFFFRHELTISDYEKILSASKKISYLWALALFKNVKIVATSVSSCFQRNISSNLGGTNKGVVNSLLRKMQLQIHNMKEVHSWTSKIICPHEEVIPPLPVHFVSLEQLKSFPSISTEYNMAWTFKLNPNPEIQPILCVPCQFYHGYLMLRRIEKKSDYEKRFGFPKSLLELPNEYVINGQVYYGVEECFLLQTIEAHQELCKQDPSCLHSLDQRQILWQEKEKELELSGPMQKPSYFA